MPPSLQAIDLSPYEQALTDFEKQLPSTERFTVQRPSQDETRYYWIRATHTRKTPTGFSPFTGELAMARVSLPDSKPTKIDTCIGSVEPSDHLICTVTEANEKYARPLGYKLERVDCITPPRQGVRFGAVSVLLGYKRKNDPLPSCYILEAGTATGQPKVLYLGKTIGATINAYSGYQPSPFACPTHAYLGRLTLNGDDPKKLTISSRVVKGQVSEAPYIDIDIDFSLQGGSVSSIWPGFLIAKAAGIVLARKLTGKIPEDCDPKLPGSLAS